MNLLHLTLTVLLSQVSPPPTELAPAPSGFPLQPAPAATAPAPPEMPSSLQIPPASNQASPAFSPMVAPTGGQVPEVPQSPAASPTIAPAGASASIRTNTLEAPAARAGAPPARTNPAADGAAESLWQSGMEATDPAAFQADRKSLLDALNSLTDTASQTQAVKAYWRLAAAIVQFSFAEEEAAVLARATDPQSPHERALLAAARAAAFARQQELQFAVGSAQYDLIERAPALTGDTVPWPSEVPLTGKYRTNFEVLFAGRVPPTGLLRIHKTLPASLAAMEGQAESAVAAGEAVDQISQAYTSGQVRAEELISAVTVWHDQRTAYVRAVVRYNEQITDYALAVMGPVADPATVISTLIAKKPAAPPKGADGVRQASATEPLPKESAASPPVIGEPSPASPTTNSPMTNSPTTAAPATNPASATAAPQEPNLFPQTQSVLKSIRVAH